MNDDKRKGALITIFAVACILICLLLSDGWGTPNFPLYLFDPIHVFGYSQDPDYDWLRPIVGFFSATRNVVSILLAVVAYGICRYLALIPGPKRKAATIENKQAGSDIGVTSNE